ncbi:protease inhibitor I42 family protein [Janthinobacterium fluminis]|uniref:Protease inhibitor I42 family protein n=1 Tax=Janthinobacterium fluminis TaxID=2987524 RepID=A0ABT5JWZ8_9BURK|nr:protease inhibitor I42 family protein [Janthinobacterium fluminis]MDC8756688.1 protease inhibitor I42 family protein [Janthinobacterium fluminis]
MSIPYPLALALLVCACAAAKPPGKSVTLLTEADAGRTVELCVGDTLTISLPGNLGTGYEWQVGVVDKTILRSRGQAEFTPSGSAPGSGGNLVLHFEAIGQGRMGLTLHYRRPFAKTTTPARRFDVTLLVGTPAA